jgi:hypothetical protein
MIPEATVYFACAELSCYFLDTATLAECEKAHCPFAYQRRREENAIDQARKDAKLKGNFNAMP